MSAPKTLNVCGVAYKITLCTPAENPDLLEALAITYSEGECANIDVRKTLSPERLSATLLHEAIHAIMTESGARFHLFGDRQHGPAATRKEELLVRMLAGALPNVLTQLGWKAPKS